MARNFPDFIEAYFKYAQDNYCPNRFHRWVGLSVLAGAVERKISIKEGKTHYFPNIYVMLVAHPAVGKSTAVIRGTNLLEGMKARYNQEFKIIPNQTTEASLIKQMQILNSCSVGNTLYMHSSGYFYASEASSSALQNVCGNFIATLTDFYDCNEFFRKQLASDPAPREVTNVCMNVLTGTTFDYLKTLVNENSVMGGFASRLLYVVEKEREMQEATWGEDIGEDLETREKLISDLYHINRLMGPAKPTPGFIKRILVWRNEFNTYLTTLDSPKLASIMGRKGTNLMKLSILLSVSERDDLVITEEHFEKAKKLVDDVTKDNSYVITSAMIANVDKQSGLNQLIARTIGRKGSSISIDRIKSAILSNGNDVTKIDATIKAMTEAGKIAMEMVGTSLHYRLLVDPDIDL